VSSERFAESELPHRYGERVHVSQNLWLRTALARLSTPDMRHPEISYVLRAIYSNLLVWVCGQELPHVAGQLATRMAEAHPREGWYRGPVLDVSTGVVVVDVVRAGIVPAQVCFEMLTAVLPDAKVRIDHLNMARVADAEGRVTGAELSGSKIGGSVDGQVVLLPDPIGATGSTAIRALEHYREHYGHPAKVIAMPMIATPEYLRAVLDGIEDVSIYAVRLDRGLSPPDVLESLPGEHGERERGLNERGYVVPGAGGMGEVLNNSWC